MSKRSPARHYSKGLMALLTMVLVAAFNTSHAGAQRNLSACDTVDATIDLVDIDTDVIGTEGPDVIRIRQNITVEPMPTISGLGGDDTICVRGAGSVEVLGGDGDDSIYAGPADHVLRGGAGNDWISGGHGDDRLYGGYGDDNLRGGPGDDTMFGSIGDDTIIGEQGFDVLHGGPGDDFMHAGFNRTSDPYGSATLEDTAGSRMFGGAGNDVIWGGNRWDRIQGGAGNDIIGGFEGRDYIRGGSGNDLLIGGANIDDVNGNTGRDHIFIDGRDRTSGGLGLDTCVWHPDDTIVGPTSCETTYTSTDRQPLRGTNVYA